MNQLKLLLVGLLVALCSILGMANGSQDCNPSGRYINGYYGSWAAMQPKDIDPSLLTHLTYSFFGLMGHSGLVDPGNPTKITEVIKLKQRNPDLKVLAAFGGWNEELTPRISAMAADPAKRRTFIDSALKFIEEYNFDGLDMDWEYPEGYASKQNFVTLLKELSEKLKPKNLLLTTAVGASRYRAEQSYDIPEIAKYVDRIHLMSYDFNMNGISANAPLRSNDQNNVESCVDYWLRSGVPADKLVLGLPFYAYEESRGAISYREVCKKKQNGGKRYWNDDESVPYLVGSGRVSYDDEESLGLKVDYANAKGLGGVFIWSVDHDDYDHTCRGQKFPLLNAVNSRICNKPSSNSNSPKKTLHSQKRSTQQYNKLNDGPVNTGNQKPVKMPDIDWNVVPEPMKDKWAMFRKPSSAPPNANNNRWSKPQPTETSYRHNESPAADRRVSAPQLAAPAAVKCTNSEFRYYPHETNPTKYYECVYNQPISRDCPLGTMYFVEKGMCDHIYYRS